MYDKKILLISAEQNYPKGTIVKRNNDSGNLELTGNYTWKDNWTGNPKIKGCISAETVNKDGTIGILIWDNVDGWIEIISININLTKDEIYYRIQDKNHSIFRYSGEGLKHSGCITGKQIGYHIQDFNKFRPTSSGFESLGEIKVATEDEKKWLLYCIEHNKFITMKKFEKELKNKPKFEIGKWYIAGDWISKFDKILKEHELWGEHIHIKDKYYDKSGYLPLKSYNPIKEISIEEIQQYLPKGHSDLIVEGFKLPEKWCIKQCKELYKWNISIENICSYSFNSENSYYYLVEPEFSIHNWDFNGKSRLDTHTEITFDQFKKYVLGSDYDIDKKDKLISGEIYYGTISPGSGSAVFKPNECELYSNNSRTDFKGFQNSNSPDGVDNVRLATQEEKDWLNACIKAGKFIPKDKIMNTNGKCVNTTTQEQFDFLLSKLNPLKKESLVWKRHKENTCMSLNNEGAMLIGYVDPIDWYIKEHIQIISFQKWLDENEYVFEEKVQPTPKKWSAGTYVVFCDKISERSSYGYKSRDISKIVESSHNIKLENDNWLDYNYTKEPDYIKWFATKIEAKEFAKTLVESKIPEYVELLKSWSVDGEFVGEIFDTNKDFQDQFKEFKNISKNWNWEHVLIKKSKYFKPSTKEAYENQTKTNNANEMKTNEKDYWCVKITEDNKHIVGEFYAKQCWKGYEKHILEQIGKYYTSHNISSDNSVFDTNPGSNYDLYNPNNKYPEISTEEFYKKIGHISESISLIKENLIEGRFYHFWYKNKMIGSLVKWKHYSMDIRCSTAPKKWASNTLSNSAYCNLIKEATSDEIKWLETCEKANKFVSKEEALKTSKTEFKKDDYIVIINGNEHSFKKNHCFKQRESRQYIRPYCDCNNGKNNGWDTLSFKRSKNWRYATTEEIAEYNRLGKPFDVTKIESSTILEDWLKDTKAKNLSLDKLDKLIGKCPYNEVYGKLEGKQSKDKAKILYNQWNGKSGLVKGGIYYVDTHWSFKHVIFRYISLSSQKSSIYTISRLFKDNSGGCSNSVRDFGDILNFKIATSDQMHKLEQFEESNGYVWDGAKLVKIDNPYELGGTAQPIVEPNPFEEIPIQLREIKSIINKVN